MRTLQGVDFVVDGGERLAYPSTVIDMTGVKPTILRRGKASTFPLFVIHVHCDYVHFGSIMSI